MQTPRSFYKEAHPDCFSDTKVVEVTEVDRSLLEYHLASLTSRSQETDFERFARRLCEKTICPNLVPTTGPTGGGDSKADSETFPVADSLALTWYGGIAREASMERWAFAFSAKKVWLSKVQGDIKKIAETARDYTTAFFVTNQSIPARRRSEVEDKLHQKHGIRVRILDLTWIMEEVFRGRHEQIAINELKVTGLSHRIVQPGPADAARTSELEAIEARIAEAAAAGQLGPALVDEALAAADLCRCLELPRDRVNGSFERADRFARKYGTARQQIEVAYQWGRTHFWWYEDTDAAMEQYDIAADRAQGTDNVFDLEQLHEFWTALINAREDANYTTWIEGRRTALRAELARLSQSTGRPSVALQAKTLLLENDILWSRADASLLNPAFDELRSVLESAEGLVGFPMKKLATTISLIGQFVSDSESYDLLLEKLVEVESQRESEVRAARLLLTRGSQLIEQGKLLKAIAVVGQALGRLYKHETRKEIVVALYLCGHAYEQLGLLWAARGTYIIGASIAANDFWRYQSITDGFVSCANGLKWVEMRLGRLPHALAWHELELALSSSTLPDQSDQEMSEMEFLFDGLVARLIMRIPPEAHGTLGALPDTLDNLGLPASAGAALYLSGHLERMQELAGKDNSADATANNLWAVESNISLPVAPNLVLGGRITLSTKILGCQIRADCAALSPCIEIGESVLSVLESLLSTVAADRAFAFEPEVTLEINPVDSLDSGLLSVTEEERLGRSHFAILCAKNNPYGLGGGDLTELRNAVFEVALQIFPYVAQFRDLERELEILFKDERVMERAGAFAGTIGSVGNVLGQPKFQLSDWVDPEATMYEMVRTEPWTPTIPANVADSSEGRRHGSPRGEGEAPPDLINYDRLSHDQMSVQSLIRQRLWNQAGWTGTVFSWSPYLLDMPPWLGLIFENERAARDIFQAWKAELGEVDEANRLRLTIVRGIDRAMPHAYRVIVGVNFDEVSDPGNLVMLIHRINRMNATNPANLDNFLAMYEVHKRFILAPAIMGADGPDILSDSGIGMYELVVRNAWEIGMNDPDIMGVHADDDVIVPEGVENPPVNQLQEWKRKRQLDA